MGYTTDFSGSMKITPPIDEETKNLINGLNKSRRMGRDTNKLKELGFNGNYGIEAEFFHDIEAMSKLGYDEYHDPTIININRPPKTQPGLWLGWLINDEGELEWDGMEKFYHYRQWLQYLMDNILIPRGYTLNGSISYQGEDHHDVGCITIKNNKFTSY